MPNPKDLKMELSKENYDVKKQKKVWIGYVPDREHWKHLFYWWEQDATYRVKFLGLVGGVSHKKIQKHRTRNWEHQTKIRITVEAI